MVSMYHGLRFERTAKGIVCDWDFEESEKDLLHIDIKQRSEI